MTEDQEYSPALMRDLEHSLRQLLGSDVVIPENLDKRKKVDAAVKPALEAVNELIESYADNERVMTTIPFVMKSYIDQMWVKHLETMSHLKEGIGLRSYQQEDPMRIYQREGLELFAGNFQNLRHSIASELLGFLHMLKNEDKEATE